MPNPQPTTTAELPDSPGIWLRTERNKEEWALIGTKYSGKLSAEAWCIAPKMNPTLGWFDVDDADFPRGSWSRAVPAADLAAKEAELAKYKGALKLLLADKTVREAAESQWLCLLNMDYGEGVNDTPLIAAIENGLAVVPEVWAEYSEKKALERKLAERERDISEVRDGLCEALAMVEAKDAELARLRERVEELKKEVRLGDERLSQLEKDSGCRARPV